ncbi:DUF45 domain-containing protein [Candidatus Saccharibacteria bacterium]|nr:DUF45 domain-containing protein [Candidatus Saccharibacteria bacterium]
MSLSEKSVFGSKIIASKTHEFVLRGLYLLGTSPSDKTVFARADSSWERGILRQAQYNKNMSVKEFDLPEIGIIKLYKRRGSSNLRISLSAVGGIRVTMPKWLPYKAGIEFARSKQDWILKHQTNSSTLLSSNMRIGKAHSLIFIPSVAGQRITTRLVGNEARVIYPRSIAIESQKVQKAAERVAIKALTVEAQKLLPSRLAEHASRHGFSYRNVQIKRLASRWGSCNQQKEITLNCFLMQLPWELIDYVLLHELVHTKVMRHGEPFWSELALYLPNVADARRVIRSKQPHFAHTKLVYN